MSLTRQINIALPYAQALAEKGLRVVLPANSDFVPLVRSATPTIQCLEGTDQNVFFEGISQVSEIGSGFNEYEEIHGATVDNLKPLVQSHIRIAQAVAQFIVEIRTKTESYIQNIPDGSPLGRFSVIEDPFADVLDDDFVQDLVKHPPVVVRRPEAILTTTPRTFEQVTLLMSTSDNTLNQLVQQAASLFGTNDEGKARNFLEEVYSGFFCGHATPSRFYNLNDFAMLPSGERAVVALIVYLIADKLRTEVPDDAFGALNEFRFNAEAMANLAHQTLVNAYSEKKYQANNGLVILDTRPGTNSIVVDKCSYGAFLEAGGRVELVLGSKVANLGLLTNKELSENSERAAKAWREFATAMRITVSNERESFLTAIYKAVWSEFAATKLDFEEAVRSENPALFETLSKEAFDYIDAQEIEALDDTFGMLEHLIAKIRFGYTPAAFFLKEMKADQKANPDSDARSNALAAAIKYVASYLRTMTTIQHVV